MAGVRWGGWGVALGRNAGGGAEAAAQDVQGAPIRRERRFFCEKSGGCRPLGANAFYPCGVLPRGSCGGSQGAWPVAVVSGGRAGSCRAGRGFWRVRNHRTGRDGLQPGVGMGMRMRHGAGVV